MLDCLPPLIPTRSANVSYRGFTLLELIVVMILLGLIGTAVLPNLPGLGGALGRNQELRSIELQLARLGDLAFADANNYYLSGPDTPSDEIDRTELLFQGIPVPPPATITRAPLNLSDGWTVQAPSPIFFLRNGFCTGGDLLITQGLRVFEYALAAPDCDELINVR